MKNVFDWSDNRWSAQSRLDEVEKELVARGGHLRASSTPSIDFDKMEFEFDSSIWRLKRNRWVRPEGKSRSKTCIWYAVRQVGTGWEKIFFPREYELLVESIWVERNLLEESK